MTSPPPLLRVSNLSTQFKTPRGTFFAVEDVSLTLQRGQTLGLVGESGCGKSTLGRSIVRLIEPWSGSIKLDGTELVGLSQRELRPHRHRMQMVYQDPLSSMNPRHSIRRIMEEPLAVNNVGTEKERKDLILGLLTRVGLREDALDRFPHEFSGGQRQRICIARALTLHPDIIICDEAVSALDVSLQAQVLNLLAELQEEMSIAYLFVSHDLAVVEHMSDWVAVMYLGKVVEIASRSELWMRPGHPYTQAMIDTIPVMEVPQKKEIKTIEGDIPDPRNPPSGCRFRTRCPQALPLCAEQEPKLAEVHSQHWCACHLHTASSDGEIGQIVNVVGKAKEAIRRVAEAANEVEPSWAAR